MSTSTMRAGLAAAMATACLGLLASTPSALAQDRPGRYAMSPVEGGFARLDTETGQMSVCRSQKDAAGVPSWSCQPMADSGADDARSRRLEAENKELRAEIRRMEDQLGLNGPKGDQKQAERPGGGLTLPSEAEVDKALSYMERMIKKFQETMKRLEKDHDGQKGI